MEHYMANEILPFPASLIDRVVINNEKKTIIVDRRILGNPLLLTWVKRNLLIGLNIKVNGADLDEVVKMRTGARSALSDDIDMVVREGAIEIMCQAAAYGANDIHFMLRGEHTEIQIDVKGELRVLARKTQEEGEALTRAIYQGIAETRDKSFNTMDYQNAQIPGSRLPTKACLTSVRVVRGPCYPQANDGAFMTMRLQYSSAPSIERRNSLPALPLPRTPDGRLMLLDMGWTEAQVEKILTLSDTPNGLIAFTGPTGSGKTTAIYEALKQEARTKPHRRQITIEDPVEYPMEWAVQMAVTDKRNDADVAAAFRESVRVGLRMAPKTILIGELRGPDVALSALEAAVTGHQVWTTLHVTDPFLFVDRLELMDSKRLHRSVFCDHQILRGIIATRLVPELCPNCRISVSKQPGALSTRIASALATWGDTSQVHVKGPGCETCNNDGTVGRFAVAEVVITDAELMKDFINYDSETARANYRARANADPSMLESAINRVLAGSVDPRAVENSIDLIEPRKKGQKRKLGAKK